LLPEKLDAFSIIDDNIFPSFLKICKVIFHAELNSKLEFKLV